MINFPLATRPCEYIAFFMFKVPTGAGTGHVFSAVDAFSEFVFMLGVENDSNPETVLTNIEMLLEHKDFSPALVKEQGFTIVLDSFADLLPSIQAIISPYKGKVIINKPFSEQIAK
ncbi:MAG TPA: hypothetical protein VK921_18250, partial [Anditalea sp.]|nr:hypothetical protein [Anditalea sp.]